MDSPFGERSSKSRLRRRRRAFDGDIELDSVGPAVEPFEKRGRSSALLYVADADGRLWAASDELRRLIAHGNGLSAQHHDAIARLKSGESPVTYRATAVVDGRICRFVVWHTRLVGTGGQPTFVGVYADNDGAEAESDRPPRRGDAIAGIFERAKSALFGHVSHELRTPLNAIIGFADLSLLQAHGRLDGHYLSYLSDIRSSAAQLLHVVDNLLEAAAQDADATWRTTTQPLSEIVDGARAAVAPLAAARGIDLSSVGVADDCIVRSGAERLRLILRQLLSNAVKFTPPQGRVGVDVSHPDRETLEITVWDNGTGIPPSTKASLFEDFATLSPDVMAQPCDGLGLGLANARRLARQMGGDIHVESETGRGSRFTVTLPSGKEEPGAPRLAKP